jgi:hypothetical protein
LVDKALTPATSRGALLKTLTPNSTSKTALYEGIFIYSDVICGVFINSDLAYIHSEIKKQSIGDWDSHFAKDNHNNFMGQVCTGSVPAGSGVTMTELSQAIWADLSKGLNAQDL